ncbi:hypothetical protein ACFOU2_14500 [Bacillus songklensis]|uniref:Uncharacterized protein n=1 Tax=Bacillus songklensis TaxID=1069116 RepID=A0ABV8B660_9BACI
MLFSTKAGIYFDKPTATKGAAVQLLLFHESPQLAEQHTLKPMLSFEITPLLKKHSFCFIVQKVTINVA